MKATIAWLVVELGVQPSELLDGPPWLIPALMAHVEKRNKEREAARRG